MARLPERWWSRPESRNIFPIIAELDATIMLAMKIGSRPLMPKSGVRKRNVLKTNAAEMTTATATPRPNRRHFADAQIQADREHQKG